MNIFNLRNFCLCFIVCLFSCSQSEKVASNYIASVDPIVGSGGHGHVFVGANVPFGMVQLGPNNIFKGWDWCSGYHYSDSTIIGFSHTHLSGTGIGDYGDILFMPVVLDSVPATFTFQQWASKFSHSKEKVSPGYYSVHLDTYNIDVELTATQRVGFHKYTYPSDQKPQLIVDLSTGIGWDKLTKAKINQIDDQTISGFRYSTGWAKDQRIYYTTKFSQKIKSISYLNSISGQNDSTNIALIEFDGNGELLVKTALSPVSEKGAAINLETELSGWDFPAVVSAAQQSWNKELQKIEAKFSSSDEEKIFYTAMYHTSFFPSLFNDRNGDFPGKDSIVVNNGHQNYTVFSLWDTYRALHPLFTITEPERVNDLVNTMLAIYKQQGTLPIWHLAGNETYTMVGNHAIPVIADAYLKGFNGFDPELAYEAVKTSSMVDFRGMNHVKELSYLPADEDIESVARALEYAIDDWCVAQMAQKMGKTDDFEYFSKRAKLYQLYFDKQKQFMRGKLSTGNFRDSFNPFESKHREDDFCEGNAWQYTWLVPQDPYGLIDLFGGEQSFTLKLDSLFTVSSELGAGASPDVSGLIGQYAHGNEPSHHITYLYAFAGQQWKTATKVREILKTLYHNGPDGLSGNEDCGQMSAWYIFSSLGFYPVNPANGVYVFGSPIVHEATIHLPEGKNFKIIAENNSDQNIYIQSVELNGKPYEKSFITHQEIMNGGSLKFVMGPKPNVEFGSAKGNRPQ